MPTYNPETSFRRGATRSAGHSPASSPRDLSTSKLNLNGQNLFANGMSSSNNSSIGWTGWGGTSLASKRHASGSSTASGAELIGSTANSSFLGHSNEGWQSSRPKSATWEDTSDAVQRKDQSQQQDFALSGLSSARQASYPGARPDDRSAVMAPKQPRYNNPLGSEFGGPRLPSTFNNGSFMVPHPVPSGAVAYPGSGVISNAVDSELSMAMRGMTVGDELHSHGTQEFASMPLPQPTGLYSGFTPADYANYYPNATGAHPAPFIAGHPAGNAAQIGMYYDFSAATATPYYYAAQPMLYAAPSPMLAPQLSHSNTTGIVEKGADAQFNVQQATPSHPLARPSHAPRGYRASMDYTSRGRSQSGFSHRYGAQSVSIRRYPEKPRSALLEEYRADRSRKWETRDIYGYIAEFSTDQHGSRFVQTKIEQADPEEKQKIFDEIAPTHIIRLVQDVFGNYVIQKFFEFGTPTQKATLAGSMRGHLVPLSMQMYGCRVIQKAIECLSPEWQSHFVHEIRPQVLKCVKDSNGNHVVQKLIEKVPSERVAFVQSFCGNVYELATHAYGCRVLQRCLEHLPQDITRPLLDELYECALGLMQDQFGNYVVQFVIAQGSAYDKRRIISTLFGEMLNMSRHKFASNVCEKALLLADPADRRVLIQEILSPQADGNVPIAIMMKDSFANYVLQRALECADDEQKEALVSRIKPHLASIRRFSTTYSKHITNIERDLGKTIEPYSQSGHVPDSQNDSDSSAMPRQS